MAAFDLISNMNDVALRPRLLRTLIRDHLPDDKHPFGSPSQLSKVVSMVKTHSLLSESFDELTDQVLISKWKSAVDSWVKRLMLLVSNDMPDKCWAGICLLGVTCQECSSDRFLASYSDWLQKLLSHIQVSATSHFVKVASCASISDLLIRLGGFPNVKKDGTAHAGKVIQPVLKLLNDDHSEAVWDGAVHLLCTAIAFFPFSVGRHYESAEAAIASKFLSGTCSFNMLKKLAHCLALLPKSRGDVDSWSLMMQKILIWINNHLNDAFNGFEGETKHFDEAIRLLLPPGKDLPPPFGGLAVSGVRSQSMRKRSEHLLTSSVSALFLCCSTMITSSYPIQVTVHVRFLLTLVERVLMMDASLPPSLPPFVTATQQELLSSELPILHLYSLELLTAIIKGVRSQLLPHAASIVRLISVYFKKCALPELRTKMYSITKILLISMGVGTS
ncbi:Coatomer beta subunit [Trema orientale]|uniref:Coatomer beta subunit n=1 Tax=Trema orientale TaxID=63057 RepID=A0A2P5DBL9_TREOI|nr:Coatomer beta subunit [Trema orientale]